MRLLPPTPLPSFLGFTFSVFSNSASKGLTRDHHRHCRVTDTGKSMFAMTKNVLEYDNSREPCIIKFHAGPLYEDITFRLFNEQDYSHKVLFRCTFERGILHLYSNFMRYRVPEVATTYAIADYDVMRYRVPEVATTYAIADYDLPRASPVGKD
ncbi:hypothetical protein CRG98_011273 [Punica granatum]|uniref:Splicing factor Cactin C-terminal domain-containing protein n=1 Tax=Punica granatum TaxID=22663 RepID=A0A2I0KIL5_PUNGR|nr:hypothetical protein CRG98_011273 [Punica granatum]